MNWKLVFGSVQGTSHAQSGTQCQDYCAGNVSGATLVAACADGAGSAQLSALGAKASVDRFLEVACCNTKPTREQVEIWVSSARERLLEMAAEHGSTPRQLACTFLAALIGEGWAAFAQIGDGVIVYDHSDGYAYAFWPDNGEYANTTHFLSEDEFRQHLNISIVDNNVNDVAIITDGLQMLALDIANATVYDRFFAPLFDAMRFGPDGCELKASLIAFMDSKRVNDRTDDDKTLLLATRISCDVPAQLPETTV
jgi:hypothetical protein